MSARVSREPHGFEINNRYRVPRGCIMDLIHAATTPARATKRWGRLGGAMTSEPDLERLADRVMDQPAIARLPPDARPRFGDEMALADSTRVGLTQELAALVQSHLESVVRQFEIFTPMMSSPDVARG